MLLKEWLTMAENVVAGDAQAVADGYDAMINPSAAELDAVRAAAQTEVEEVAPADRAYDEAQEAAAAVADEAKTVGDVAMESIEGQTEAIGALQAASGPTAPAALERGTAAAFSRARALGGTGRNVVIDTAKKQLEETKIQKRILEQIQRQLEKNAPKPAPI